MVVLGLMLSRPVKMCHNEAPEELLKINKSDGLTGSSSDHFVYAPHRFAVLFTMLINVMLVHGYMPDDMLASVLVPIPKDSRA